MLSFRQWLKEVRLVHGTLADHIPSIRKNWLQPGTSEYTKDFYDDTKDTVFSAHENDVERAHSSIRGQIGKKLGKHPSQVTGDDIEKHGALVVTHSNDDTIQHDLHDPGAEYAPPQAEHGDYYSHSDMEPTGFLKGKRLRSFLQKRKLAD